MVKFCVVLFLTLSLGACARGPKRENDNALDYLNGNNYRAVPNGIPIIIDHQSPLTTISGSLLISRGLPIPEPLKYQTLLLMLGKKEIARTSTDASGTFTFTGYISNDEYKIVSLSQKYPVNEFLKITQYKTTGIRLFAVERK